MFITGLPNGPVLFCTLVSVVCRLSGSVSNAAGGWAIGQPTLHSGPVSLHVLLTLLYNNFLDNHEKRFNTFYYRYCYSKKKQHLGPGGTCTYCTSIAVYEYYLVFRTKLWHSNTLNYLNNIVLIQVLQKSRTKDFTVTV